MVYGVTEVTLKNVAHLGVKIENLLFIIENTFLMVDKMNILTRGR